MKLFEMRNWQLQVSTNAWGLSAFKKLLDRDKTKEKETALKEMLFIYFYCDIKSDYLTMDKITRVNEIKNDIGLPKKWKLDKAMDDAIALYLKPITVIEKLYRQTNTSVAAIGNYLENTAELLAERDNNGKPVTDIAKITASVQKVPKLMSDIKSAYKEVVKEQEDNENKKKGSKIFNIFEDGFK